MLTVVHRSDCLARVGGKAESGAAKSLHTLIESDAYPDIDWRIKLCGGNVNREGFALSLPLFQGVSPIQVPGGEVARGTARTCMLHGANEGEL